jgi:hypothetical protein
MRKWLLLWGLAFAVMVMATGSATPWCAFAGNPDPARRGCCSWHMGVCGCYGSRVVCCDGMFSPTCTC